MGSEMCIRDRSDDMGLIYVENIGVADRVKVTGESNRILSVKTEDVI